MGDRYNVSKLMVLCVVRTMAEMMPLPAKGMGKGVVVNCVAPGFVFLFFLSFYHILLSHESNTD